MIRRFFEAWHYCIWLLTVAMPGRILYWFEPIRGFVGYIGFRLAGFVEWCTVRLTDWDWPRPVHYLMWLCGATFERISVWVHTREWRLPRSLLFLFWLCSLLFGWVVEWLRTRQVRYLAQGTPAMLVAGLIGLVLSAQAIKPQIRDVERYRSATLSALAEEDWEAADVWQRKLVQLGVTDPEDRLQMAHVALRLGRAPRSNQLIDELAPDDSVGYPTAHYWKAQGLSRLPVSSTEVGDLLVHHLRAALSSPLRVDASVMLGRVYAKREEHDKAIRLLETVTKVKPEVELILGQLHEQLGDQGRAKRHAETAVRHFSKQLKADTQDHKIRIALVQSLQIVGHWRAAEALLIEGLKIEPARFQEPLAALYVSHYDSLRPVLLAQRLWLVDRALAIAPNHAGALQRLAELTKDESTASMLSMLLARGGAAAVSHVLLAMRAADEGAANLQDVHLKQAHRANKHTAPILNNLAWVFLRDESEDVERARLTVDMALQLAPNQPHIRYTRGNVFIRLQQWNEAIEDLEFALAALDTPAAHELLAEAYEQLGDPANAALHRGLSGPESGQQETTRDSVTDDPKL